MNTWKQNGFFDIRGTRFHPECFNIVGKLISPMSLNCAGGRSYYFYPDSSLGEIIYDNQEPELVGFSVMVNSCPNIRAHVTYHDGMWHVGASVVMESVYYDRDPAQKYRGAYSELPDFISESIKDADTRPGSVYRLQPYTICA